MVKGHFVQNFNKITYSVHCKFNFAFITGTKCLPISYHFYLETYTCMPILAPLMYDEVQLNNFEPMKSISRIWLINFGP